MDDETVTIKKTDLEDILYHLNGIMNLFGFGREYAKIARLVKRLPLEEVNVANLYQVNKILKDKESENAK